MGLLGSLASTCGTLATLRPLGDEPASALCEEPGGAHPSRPQTLRTGTAQPAACRLSAWPTGCPRVLFVVCATRFWSEVC